MRFRTWEQMQMKEETDALRTINVWLDKKMDFARELNSVVDLDKIGVAEGRPYKYYRKIIPYRMAQIFEIAKGST